LTVVSAVLAGTGVKSGMFTIKASIAGKNGPVSIVPPDPGTDACFALQLGVDRTSGDRYDVLFGPGSKLTNNDGKLFKAMKPPAEGVCPFGPTTTTTTLPTTTTSSTSTTTAAPTTTTTTSTTTTTVASPSGAFLDDGALGAG
jgi:hypothetical protein